MKKFLVFSHWKRRMIVFILDFSNIICKTVRFKTKIEIKLEIGISRKKEIIRYDTSPFFKTIRFLLTPFISCNQNLLIFRLLNKLKCTQISRMIAVLGSVDFYFYSNWK
ncbi:hypothetical protein BpHYR1_030400 [Brachionus plicatilis]|uniref:Uncharacterized protein n=1 Tax=Brachionus plicatilis TaxID=10195 RepID=A0A3M7T2A3_BRAPC|nr:hypothetical protein BpHYR1_030400 [Brachionus plicatilis]